MSDIELRKMDETSPDARAVEVAVKIVPYDETWPARFDAERSLLEVALAPWLAGDIEHIGSTAVAGLAGKPVIDIMAPVADLETSRPLIEVATRLGYLYYPYKPELMHWFCKPSAEVRSHHLHLVPRDSPLWKERLLFRDALRQDAVLAAQYAELKLRLSRQFRLDREGYTEAKTPFVVSVLARLGGSGQSSA
jgi:GrpB-like predicted nucleotidyltransferase (UPF0157 family)